MGDVGMTRDKTGLLAASPQERKRVHPYLRCLRYLAVAAVQQTNSLMLLYISLSARSKNTGLTVEVSEDTQWDKLCYP